MAAYEVTKRSYIGGRLREVGDIVEYEGKAGSGLKLAGKGRKPPPDPEPEPPKADPAPVAPAWEQPKE